MRNSCARAFLWPNIMVKRSLTGAEQNAAKSEHNWQSARSLTCALIIGQSRRREHSAPRVTRTGLWATTTHRTTTSIKA